MNTTGGYMTKYEEQFIKNNYVQFKKFFSFIEDLAFNIENGEFFYFIFKDLGFKWEDQIIRWGSSFFSSALPARIIPDYFLYNGDLLVDNKKINNIWDNLMSPITERFFKKKFEDAAAILEPKLCLFALKSSRLPNARLAKYFMNQDMVNEMKEYLGFAKQISNPTLVLSSPYWQLVEAVHGHLFGRKNFFSELKGNKPLTIMITFNKDKSLNYFNYTEKILYVDIEVAQLLGSELNLEQETEIHNQLRSIKMKIAQKCFFSIMKLIEKRNEESISIHHIIADSAVKISSEIQNLFDLEKRKDTWINQIFDKIFFRSYNANQIMKNLSPLFNRMEIGRKGLSITKADKLRFLITSLFDLFMILPKSKSFLFNYASGKEIDDLEITWVIVGNGPTDEPSFKKLLQNNPYELKKIHDEFKAVTERIYGSNESLYEKERNLESVSQRIVGALTRLKVNDLSADLKFLKNNKFLLKVRKDQSVEINNKNMGLYALCLVLETCSYLTGEVHENAPLSFTFLISSSHAWNAFSDTISDAEFFVPEINENVQWEPEKTAKMIKANYSILQIPRVVAFFDRTQTWENKGLKWGQIVKVLESGSNKGLIDYPFFYNSEWGVTKNWTKFDFIVQVKGTEITVLRGHRNKVVPFLKWNTQRNELKDLVKDDDEIEDFISKFLIDQTPVVKKLVKDVLMTIASTPGEGALIALNSFNHDGLDELKKYFYPMDINTWEQRWRREANLLSFNRDTLRAALRMDGGSRIVKKGQSLFEASFRFSLRPEPGVEITKDQLKKLIGRGSRHHSAAALSIIIKDSLTPYSREKGAVIVVSADGPITLLPYSEWCSN